MAVFLLLVACTAHRPETGTGDVAFRLLWSGRSDLDLFVADPAGACIFFGDHEAASGGLLDVDCNGGSGAPCPRPVENVFWPTTTAPPGDYLFWAHAHSLRREEVPVGFELELLRGDVVAWRIGGSLAEHDELFGPFRYRFPGGEVTSAPAADRPVCRLAGSEMPAMTGRRTDS